MDSLAIKRNAAALLALAKASVCHGLTTGTPLPVDLANLPDDLRAPGAAFVTLHRGGKLRGCIGSPSAHQPLAIDVAENAFSAAFRDPRFTPLTEAEVDGLELSIAVLTPPAPIGVKNEADLLRQLRPHVDGLIIESQGRRALFLPAVWEQLRDPVQFLAHLKHKAGLPHERPARELKAWRFEAVEVKA